MSSSTPSAAPSLIEFLRQSGIQLRIFDMGRRVSKISAELFHKVEQAQTPYPSPYLHHAWVSILLWNPKERAQSAVWFLKLPLDEQGFLVQAARDDIMNRLLQNVTNAAEGSQNDALKDNPFSFKPEQEKMAIFHAYATQATGAAPSQYYDFAKSYASGEQGFSNWQSLGFQGIADLVVRFEEGNNTSHIAHAIEKMPHAPYEILCSCLENISLPHEVFSALQKRFEKSLEEAGNQAPHIAAQIRGISMAKDYEGKVALLSKVLKSESAKDAEVLAAIATRCDSALRSPALLQAYLEALAVSNAGQIGFSRILADLMFMPDLRALILNAFRSEDRSPALTKAIGQMFGDNIATKH
ncbi:MAG: DUF3549 family protein [Pontibacterium sp.]